MEGGEFKRTPKGSNYHVPTRNLEIDDMVVVREDNMPSTNWGLGRIVSCYPEADDRVRMVDIRTARGTIKRPVHKVVLLPMEGKATSESSQ